MVGIGSVVQEQLDLTSLQENNSGYNLVIDFRRYLNIGSSYRLCKEYVESVYIHSSVSTCYQAKQLLFIFISTKYAMRIVSRSDKNLTMRKMMPCYKRDT